MYTSFSILVWYSMAVLMSASCTTSFVMSYTNTSDEIGTIYPEARWWVFIPFDLSFIIWIVTFFIPKQALNFNSSPIPVPFNGIVSTDTSFYVAYPYFVWDISFHDFWIIHFSFWYITHLLVTNNTTLVFSWSNVLFVSFFANASTSNYRHT